MTTTALPLRIGAALAALITAALLIVAPAPAQAQARNLAIFGDSVVANPAVPEYLAEGLFANLSSGNSSRLFSGDPSTGCSQGNNWGREAAGNLGLEPWDYSCNGTVSMSQGPQVAAQVDRAIREGGLSPATQRVVITHGFNDTYNNRHLGRQQFIDAFVAANAPQINRIRAAAPNARIQIVGYPSMTAGDNICLFHIGPNIHETTPFPDLNYWQWLTQDSQIALARATGVEFLDTKAATAENHMCAPDHKRMWAGLVDFYAGPGSMPFHVNERGHRHVGQVIARS